MANIAITNGTPKDVNNRLRGATGLDPDDPNDMAFKLVTILYFLCHKNLLCFRTAHTHLPPICLSLLRCFPLCHFCVNVGIIGIVFAGGVRRRCRATVISECFWVGSGGEEGRWQAYPSILGRQRCNTIGNEKGRRWRRWACCDVLGIGTSARHQGRRAAVGALQRCPDGVFEVALAGRRRRGREGHEGTMHFAQCGHPEQCWPSGWGHQTMAQWNYSVALLLQHAAWTTLQFRRLHVTVTIVSSFLERALHSTLPPVAAAAIAHAMEEYCGGGGGGSADFAALVAPYSFAFGNGGAAGWVGAVAVWRRGGQRRGPSGSGPGNEGKGSNNGGGAK